MEGFNLLSIWISCFTCVFSKILDPDDKDGDYFKCTHGWHKAMGGSYQRMHVSRKCGQHKKRRLILRDEEDYD